MNPSVTMRTKIRLDMAQKMNVWYGSDGPNCHGLKDPCHTTSATDNTSATVANP